MESAFFQNRQKHVFALKFRTVLPPAWFLCPHSMGTVPVPLCALGRVTSWGNPTVCKSQGFAGTGADRAFPVKVSLDKRKGLGFQSDF